MRKALPMLALGAVLSLGAAACGDRTVTSAPPATQPAATNAGDTSRAVDTDLTEVDQLVRDIEADLTAVDQDATTPEGDPSE